MLPDLNKMNEGMNNNRYEMDRVYYIQPQQLIPNYFLLASSCLVLIVNSEPI